MILNDKTEWEPTQDMLDKWKEAYPGVSVEAELAKMAAWALSNPAKRKTARGVSRFCNSWLAKAQDRGGSSPNLDPNALITKTRDMTTLDDLTSNFLGDPAISEHFLEKFGQVFINGRRITK